MPRKRAPILLLCQQPGLSIVDRLRHSPRAKAGHRKSHGLRFQENHSQSFSVARSSTHARHRENARSIHPLADNGGRLHSQEGVIPQVLAGQVLEVLAKLSVADHHEFGFR